MAIEGRLSEMDIPTLVQYVCNEGQRARLRIEHGGQEAFIDFAGGQVVHAESGEQRGEEAFYRIMRWEDGAFALEAQEAAPTQTIETPWSALLMNGLQQRDEVSWDELGHDEEEYDMPENIQDILEELGGQVPGFITAAVVGMDGLGIADHAATDVNVEAVNAQMTLLVKLVDTTINKLNPTDGVEDYLLTTENAYLLVRFLEDKQYYLGLAADREATRLGNMRLNSRIYAERVNEALPH